MAARRKAEAPDDRIGKAEGPDERVAPGHRRSEPGSAPDAPARGRFFFALRTDRAAAVALGGLARDLRDRYGGRSMHADDVHLTLAFVGMRPLVDAQPLRALLAGEIASQPGALALSRLGSFGHGVVWVAPPHDVPRHDAPPHDAPAQDAPPAPNHASAQLVHALAGRLRARLLEARVAFDDRPLRLHVTLVRGARGFHPEDAGALLPRPVVPASWSLALGWSDAGATSGPRYAWHSAPR